MPPEDVKTPPSGEDKEDELEEKDEESEEEESEEEASASDDKKGKLPKSIPYSRFKEVNEKANKATNVARWYQEHVGSPEEVLAYKQWKEGQKASSKAKKDDNDDDSDIEKIPEKELAKFRAVMRKADPDYAKYLALKADEEQKAKEDEDEIWTDTENEILGLAKEAKLPYKDKDYMKVLGPVVMITIRDDKRLMREWRAGKMEAVQEAFDRIRDKFLGAKSTRVDTKTLRDIKNLQTLPRGGTSSTPKPPPLKKGEGITKDAHDQAWALMQAHED